MYILLVKHNQMLHQGSSQLLNNSHSQASMTEFIQLTQLMHSFTHRKEWNCNCFFKSPSTATSTHPNEQSTDLILLSVMNTLQIWLLIFNILQSPLYNIPGTNTLFFSTNLYNGYGLTNQSLVTRNYLLLYKIWQLKLKLNQENRVTSISNSPITTKATPYKKQRHTK